MNKYFYFTKEYLSKINTANFPKFVKIVDVTARDGL